MRHWGEATRAMVECAARGNIVEMRELALDLLDGWMPFDGASFYAFAERLRQTAPPFVEAVVDPSSKTCRTTGRRNVRTWPGSR